MSYFKELEAARERLDRLAQEYLDKFDFVPTYDIADMIYRKCWDIFNSCGEDLSRCPENVRNEIESVTDCHMPYLSYAERPGSMKKTLALSLVSVDAHLRNLLERLEGRAQDRLPFGIEADV